MKWLGAFVFGAVVCTALDHQHVVWGVLSYSEPVFWQQAWWVPLLFGCATLVTLGSVDPMRRMLGAQPAPPPPRALVALDLASFMAAYYFTSVGQHLPDVVTGVLVGTWLVRVAAGLPGWAVAFCIGTAIAGPAVEGGISALGVFHYEHPDFIGVARWLPALYLHVGVAGVSLGSIMRSPAPLEVPIEIEVAV
jgi:hypothetical protein